MRVLVTGGVRSGKSRHAEELLAGRSGVVYVATGPTAAEDPDPDWAARLEAHRSSRPDTWTTVESRDLAGVLSNADRPVLVDCLGNWLTGVLDERGLWEQPTTTATPAVTALVDEVVEALSVAPEVVLVTNEVGLGVVPAHRSGRLFRDLLGVVNQRIATACDQVHLVIAGRVVRL